MKIRRRLPGLVVVLLLHTLPLPLVPVVSTVAVLFFQKSVHAQSAEAVGKIAQSITVRIEGATQGSGVLVKRDSSRYTVLTAWHVVSGQRAGEELDIYTPDGLRHPVEQGSIKRLGQVDMAVLNFTNPNSYEVARIGDAKSVSSGERVLVAGFPISGNRKLKYDSGKLVANAAVGIDQGYQLLYTNDTVSGMSGGVVLTTSGILIGMHGRGELDEDKTQKTGYLVKTGTNQGVPISYYKQYAAGEAVIASSAQAASADDYLAQARALLSKKGREQEVVRLANQVLATRRSEYAYAYRAYVKTRLGDKQGAIADYGQAIAVNPSAFAYNNRGEVKSDLGDMQGALADYSQAIVIDPQNAVPRYNRGNVKSYLGDKQGAIADYSQAIAVNPQDADSYYNRGIAKADLGDKQGAIFDYTRAIAINPKDVDSYYNRAWLYFKTTGDLGIACRDWRAAASLGDAEATNLVRDRCK